MKKVFGQTVRDIKREVNKKVLKVPGIEQKVLDATSNEPWGPHGSLLADIAQATRNYHECQMIMAVIWKRINDTGKNWRHVYKTLADFQYIDSSGRDQGSNVRKKSQSLVVLVNDKEKIIEVRQKAASNRDKFHSTSSTGGMYRPSSYSGIGGYGDRFDDDRYEGRYGSRDEGFGRERETGYRDDEPHGRYGDSRSRDGDRYSRDYEERYSRDGYRDDDYRGRSQSVDYQYGSRSRSSDRDRDHAFDDDGQYSSRGSGGRADNQSLDGRRLERKFSEQNIGAPPSYEEAVSESRSPVHSQRNEEASAASAPKDLPPVDNIPSPATTSHGALASPENQEVGASDEFDPRGPVSAAPATSNNAEMDLFGSLSDSFPSNSLAIVPTTSATTTSEADAYSHAAPATTFVAAASAADVVNQAFEDPFGDSPFKALPSTDGFPTQHQTSAPTTSLQLEPPQQAAPKADAVSNFDFEDTFSGLTFSEHIVYNNQPPTNSQYLPQELSSPQHNTDILADILPPGPSSTFTSQQAFPGPTGHPLQPTANMYSTFHTQAGPVAPQIQAGPPAQLSSGSFLPHGGSTSLPTSLMVPQTPAGPTAQLNGGNFFPQQGAPPITSHMPQALTGPTSQFDGMTYLPLQGPATPVDAHIAQTSTGPAVQPNSDVLGNLLPQAGPNAPTIPQQILPSSSGSLSTFPQPAKDKFETKSTVWADTLSRGLVNLNISGPKINPMADIGIDFDALNRKEKRMEKPATTPVMSTVNMGKAMGSGSGMGRAGATALRPTSNPMMGSGMGMVSRPGGGMDMGVYGGMNQPMGMGMQMGMNMGMGQGVQMQPPTGLPPGSNISGGYNPMMGTGGYVPQQPYGGSYR
ncbi:clathrin interactor EPSIN 2-like isoform X2 [Juglans microcarpa x Juglans regia]|uniref:clathrin interactor EPSIN 2-like isoform X2 n=1 Tax=Juglans microcarpa x Juglans regia TaxID=2249226 RepID=UPI001B7DBC0F|nr:clathrin interactor EPSIN 2-like isoform X2 [Juglans microcarpa x Juglans regia]